MMNGVKFLLVGSAVVPMMACSGVEEKKPMNILFIMSDDHSFQTLSAYDTRHMETPNIDRIAKDGVTFSRGYVANSISGPSRACLLTGKHSHANGYYDNGGTVFNGEQQTFPKLLQNAGYQTAVIGKWHLNSDPTGFDYWDILIGQGTYYKPTFIDNGEKVVRDGYATTVTTDLALDWLDKGRDKDKPFCLLLHHKAPHRTWMPDIQDLGMFDDKKFELPENFHDMYDNRLAAQEQAMGVGECMALKYDLKVQTKVAHGLDKAYESGVSRLTDEELAVWNKYYGDRTAEYEALMATNPTEGEVAEWKYQQYMEDYCSVVHSLDKNIGRVLDYLEEQGLLDNTLVVYTADQGFYMGEHGWFDKRFMYEESFRTPLVARLPGGVKGTITDLVQNIDYAPTFLELAGVEVPADIHGESFLPLLKDGKADNWRKSLYYHYYEFPGSEHEVKRHYGVATERYKLIHFYYDIDCWELYDLETDPNEMNNIYGKKGTEAITSELMAELKRLEQKYDSPAIDIDALEESLKK